MHGLWGKKRLGTCQITGGFEAMALIWVMGKCMTTSEDATVVPKVRAGSSGLDCVVRWEGKD